MTTANDTLYQERLVLIKRAIHVEHVDRVPVIYMGDAFSPRFMGMKLSEYVSNPEAPVNVTIAAMDRIGGFDGINLAGVGRRDIGFGFMRMKMPGRELPNDSVWQVEEVELMKPEDYDTIIEKGYEVFQAEAMKRTNTDMGAFQANMAWMATNAARKLQDYRSHGYVIISGFGMGLPLELFAGARTTPQFFYDLYRRPDKVKAAMDAAMPALIRQTIMFTKMSPVIGSWIGGFRGAPTFLAPKLWDKFFFPYLLQMVEALIENDIVPVLHFDQCWDREVSRFLELPKKKCVLNTDGMTNLRRLREIVGDHLSLMGDVPSTLFAIGTPEQVRIYVRDLVRDIGPQGLLLAPGCDAPVNTKPENMEAFAAAAHEFGKV